MRKPLFQLSIGNIPYNVHLLPQEVIDPDKEGYVGRHLGWVQMLPISDTCMPDAGQQILWHEILHAICDQRNVTIEDNALDAIAHGLYVFFEENNLDQPEFMDTIYTALSELRKDEDLPFLQP